MHRLSSQSAEDLRDIQVASMTLIRGELTYVYCGFICFASGHGTSGQRIEERAYF